MESNRLIPSSQRPLGVVARRDLAVSRQTYQGRGYWVIKDPLTLKYFRFEDEEYAILQMLDGRHNASEILRDFHDRFAPQRLTSAELFQFVAMLHRSGLLISNRVGQGTALRSRLRKQKAKQWQQQVFNLMSYRLRGIDPDRLLAALAHSFGWLFTLPAMLLALLLMTAAGAIVAANWDTFLNKLPSFSQFFAGSNWLWLAIALSATKIVHELGHGVACRRFGCQCHEMGVMFLVFTPCLYCNVSDAWMLPSKWKRMAISAAGMYVELIMASLATLVWWWSQPGLIQQLALNVMFVSSVSTLLFNANPLMRFDGYYILSDWLEIPNLRQKASTVLQRWAGDLLLGMESPRDLFLPQRQQWFFALYSVAAGIYRWLITVSIFLFLYRVLEPYGFQLIGQLLGILMIYSLVGVPIQQLIRYFAVPGRWQSVKPNRMAISCALIGLVGFGILAIPLPYYVHCACYVELADSQGLFVEVPGVVSEILVPPNSYVEAGSPIMRLTNADLVRELRHMEGEIRTALASYRTQQDLAQIDPRAQGQVQSMLTAHNVAVDRFQQRLEDLPKLTISAPRDGWLLNAPERLQQGDPSVALATWQGHPLDLNNVGAYLESQTMVAQLAPDPRRLQVVLAIDQQDMEFVAYDQPVRISLRPTPQKVHEGQVAAVSLGKLREVPAALSHRFGGQLTTQTAEGGREIPLNPTYAARVELTVAEWELLNGATGRARIQVGRRTIAQRIWRGLCQTFRFEL